MKTVGRFRQSDYIWGKAEEGKVYPVVNNFFGGNVSRSVSNTCRFDFFDEENIYEIKSRKVRMNQYPTTLITTDKAVEVGKKIYFIFNFRDCVAFIQYTPQKFQDYKVKILFNKPNWEIPVADLTIFHKWTGECLL